MSIKLRVHLLMRWCAQGPATGVARYLFCRTPSAGASMPAGATARVCVDSTLAPAARPSPSPGHMIGVSAMGGVWA